MSDQHRRGFLARTVLGAGAVVGLSVIGLASAQTPDTNGKRWICPPCGCGQDGKEFDAAGACSDCGMPLIEKPAAKAAPADGDAHPPADAGASKPGAGSRPATPSTPPAVLSPPSQ